MRGTIVTVFVFALTSLALAQTSPHGSNLKIDCAYCHTTNDWTTMAKNMRFNHNEQTSFKLVGQHSDVACQSCHESLVFSEVKTDCNSCHKDVHQNSVGPNCDRCHTPATWVISDPIKMHQQTRFPLTGVHQDVDCASCHTQYAKLNFPPMDISCFSCHSKQYYSTTAPNHVQAGYSTNCTDCHGIVDVAWGTTNFDHSFFPLVGGHAIQNCFACHTQTSRATGNFKGLSTDCNSCHQTDFVHTTFPNHSQLNLSTQCQTCHTINGWMPATFDHSLTGFPLIGAHAAASVDCVSCHKTTTAVLSTDCYSCHSNDFANATDPNHVQGGFPHACDQCHSTTNWSGATFDHNTTGFPLTGGHATVQCAQCHTSGYTTAPSTACVSCHQSNFNSATNPGHVTLALSTNCTTCHTLNPGWAPATFPIHSNYYNITGAHTSLTCDQCHKGNYNTTPTSCYGCHQTDYNGTTNPPHQSAGYPTDCTQCHTQTGWSPSTFNHTQFPITSGNHASPPLLCSQCHTTISSFSIYSCTTSGCHAEANTDPHHTDVRGYVYSSTSCYTCHTNGSGD